MTFKAGDSLQKSKTTITPEGLIGSGSHNRVNSMTVDKTSIEVPEIKRSKSNEKKTQGSPGAEANMSQEFGAQSEVSFNPGSRGSFDGDKKKNVQNKLGQHIQVELQN